MLVVWTLHTSIKIEVHVANFGVYSAVGFLSDPVLNPIFCGRRSCTRADRDGCRSRSGDSQARSTALTPFICSGKSPELNRFLFRA
jgi:hypothetical protein